LPGIEDPEKAIAVLRETSLLEFVDAGHEFLPIGTKVETTYPQLVSDGATTHDVGAGDLTPTPTGEITPTAGITPTVTPPVTATESVTITPPGGITTALPTEVPTATNVVTPPVSTPTATPIPASSASRSS
jgi:hypothetical protein